MKHCTPRSHSLANRSSPSPLKPSQKKKWSRQAELPGESEPTFAQCPRASLSPQHGESPVLFTHKDQCMSSFGGSDNELESMSLAASECEEWTKSGDDSDPLPPKQTDDTQPDPEMFKELHSATNLARRATKAIGHTMAGLVVLEQLLSRRLMMLTVVDGFTTSWTRLCVTSCQKESAPPLPPVTPRQPSRLSSDPGQPQHLSRSS